MEDGSLVPVFDPERFGPSGFFTETLDAGSVLAVVFALIFIWWFIYSLVAAYHWLRFGRETWVAVPALGVYFFVSGWLLLFMTSGLH
jgi:hypothetical protein